MTLQQHVQRLVSACIDNAERQPHELLQWLCADVLADLGIRHKDPPPAELRPWLHRTAAGYADAVREHPFSDILGLTYQELSSRGKRGVMGQFFTPAHLCSFMASVMLEGDEQHGVRRPDGELWRACEPACGSGAMILGLMEQLVQKHGTGALQHWSITAIDLDPLCAQMCAAQVLANLFVHRRSLGELVVYRGNALGPSEALSVVVHATVKDLSPHLVLPALHPSRVAALRDAARSAGAQAVDAAEETSALAAATACCAPMATPRATPARASHARNSAPVGPDSRVRARTAVHTLMATETQQRQVDLFVD